jgi:3-oxoacyl-(acyl-carrier-protein) synthase
MIYLTDYRTASTTHVELIDELQYPQKVHWFPDTYARKDTGLVYAPHKLAEKVLDPELLKKLKDNPVKTAFILASGNSHFAGINQKTTAKTRLSYEYKILPLTLTQVYAGRIAQMCGAQDMVTTDASACASSLKVMMQVRELIEYYKFKRVVVLSLEDAVTNLVLSFFGETTASLGETEELLGLLPSAFDRINGKFHVAQGAVFAVFEHCSIAENKKAQLLSAYSASEASTNAIGQLESGEGFMKAMIGTLDVLESRKPISIVKTHGTGTPSNNKAERNALDTILDKGFIATSYKPTIGHTMGASGLLETCLLLDSLRETGKVPAIKNRTEEDKVFISKDTTPRDGLILSLAAGMGNIYSCAIFDYQL